MKYEYRIVRPDIYPDGTLYSDMQGYYAIGQNEGEAIMNAVYPMSVYWRIPEKELIPTLAIDSTWTRSIQTEIN